MSDRGDLVEAEVWSREVCERPTPAIVLTMQQFTGKSHASVPVLGPTPLSRLEFVNDLLMQVHLTLGHQNGARYDRRPTFAESDARALR